MSDFFGKVNITEAPVGLKLMTYRFVLNTLTDCATPLGNEFGKETIIKLSLIILFISVQAGYNTEVPNTTSNDNVKVSF